jgi:5-oxoprolinase (ATP-hydrolysing)
MSRSRSVAVKQYPTARSSMNNQWQFSIDRGGTFTDIVATSPNGQILVHKLLSEDLGRYHDAAMQGVREILGLANDAPIPSSQIASIKMGTTVATNALLERRGEPTLLLITKGFRDALRIGYQNRPDIFARQIILPEMLYQQVIEVSERLSAEGEILSPLEIDRSLQTALQSAYDLGVRACAIVLMHGYRYPDHELQLAEIVRSIGFTQISVSHQVSPLMKLVSRGDTTVVDAYLSPILRRYVEQVTSQLGAEVPLLFMQSNGGLTAANQLQGKDSILSGPAGGIVGAVKTSAKAGFDKIIGFDMGGTSTDVSHYAGEYERTSETVVAGVRLKAPMMSINTIAAGGGSIVSFDGSRYRVGPESAGANPGPACYRRGGELTVTDCNVMVGKVQPEFFPQVFGVNGDLPLDSDVVLQKFTDLATEIAAATGILQTPEEVASGFLAIAIDKMAAAIKKISTQRGYDVSDYTLCSFGGAGGQHACLIAEALGMNKIFLHPLAGVLSAYGIGVADLRTIKEQALEIPLTDAAIAEINQVVANLTDLGRSEIIAQGGADIQAITKIHLRYEGSDSGLSVDFTDVAKMRQEFDRAYADRYGFCNVDRAVIVELVAVEVIAQPSSGNQWHQQPGSLSQTSEKAKSTNYLAGNSSQLVPMTIVRIYTKNHCYDAPIYQRSDLRPNDVVIGPAIIVEPTGTNVLEPGWSGTVTAENYLILSFQGVSQSPITKDYRQPDPVLLEIFNNLFRSIAEEMGITLQNSSSSVNIKERLDFSCAIFDQQGQLIANAPHIPVHLGSMSESVRSLMQAHRDTLKPGDVYISNNPYNGGTHLPDITVVTPVFGNAEKPLFYLASRGHHADIGGITPGSMPPHSMSVEEEGILLDNKKLVAAGQFLESDLRQWLKASAYPARNPDRNIADLQAQIAANERGIQELLRTVDHYGLEMVQAYMGYVQDNAEAAVRKAIDSLSDGDFTYTTDEGCQIQVSIQIDHLQQTARVDFTGTSPQQPNNANAPLAVCMAAVLYVFRTLVDDDIPLNAGCLRPLEIIVPEGSMLNPLYPAAVVAGNVETSQAVTNALYGALGIMAAAQGTMNNFTFGNDKYQYYETICGGSGAGKGFAGTDAVQTHMTNSRLTDPEVLEWRFPLVVEEFSIRSNSGGHGQYPGGNGTIRRLRFREPMTAAILSGHRIVPPFGLQGGGVGAVGQNYVECQGVRKDLPGRSEVQMQAGDVFVIETPGGGGYGR